MVTLMKSGDYDVVSASGDASLRLIYGGDVAPVNTDLVANYKDIFDGLKLKPWNSVDGVAYGIPHGRGRQLLMYRTDVVKPAPTSWGAVFDANSPYKGKITAYDSPIYIADAALLPHEDQPDLGRHATRTPLDGQAQFNAPSTAQAQNSFMACVMVRTTPSRVPGRSSRVTTSSGRPGRSSANLPADKRLVDAILPSRGIDRWSGHNG
jgi:putative spermidine/putrescine transport system substrate-binding protein